MMKSGGWFIRCLLACEAAAVAAGFVPKVGRDLYLGQIDKYTQGWSSEEFGLWVFSMVERHGLKSSQGTELADLYDKISEIIMDYDKINSSFNRRVGNFEIISRFIVSILPTCVLDELQNAGIKELRKRGKL